jgi:hypothetical protein
MAGRSRSTASPAPAGRSRRLGKTVIALAATALLEKAIQKAVEDPRVRRKAKALGKALQKGAGIAGRKLTRVARSAGKRVHG